MFEVGAMLFLYTATPTHAGSGESVTVDLAIQREQTRRWPIFQAATLKGSLRNAAPANGDPDAIDRAAAFGYDRADTRGNGSKPPPGAEYASGALAIGDAALLAFPVASLAGVFGWVTCPAAIRDLQRVWSLLPSPALPSHQTFDLSKWTMPTLNEDEAMWLDGTGLTVDSSSIVLQDVVLRRSTPDNPQQFMDLVAWLASKALAGQRSSVTDKLKKDLVMVNDTTFTGLVEAGIPQITRVKISDETGTVADGPWDEELLPAETLLFAPILAGAPRRTGGSNGGGGNSNGNGSTAGPSFTDAKTLLNDYFHGKVVRSNGKVRYVQLGAGATIGWGWIAPAVVV